MAKVAVSVEGVPNLLAKLGRMDKGLKRVIRAAMAEALRPAFERTQELVPVKDGWLKKSGRISIRAGEKQLTAKIIYGNDSTAKHAWYQHENLGLNHPRGGQAKYVETVVRGYPFAQHLAGLINVNDAGRG